MRGNLPTTLTVIARKPAKVSVSWEDGDELTSFIARAAFVSDASNEKTKETGRSWARDGYRGTVSTELDVPNTPEFTADTRVTGLEWRAEGGMAWKVVIAYRGESYYVDLRSDVLLDLMLNGTVTKGRIEAPLVWGKVGSQMKLVRVGSDLHRALVEATALDAAPRAKVTDLKVGDVYQSKTDDRHVFLGWCSTVVMTVPDGRGYYGGGPDPVLKRHARVQAWASVNDAHESLTTLSWYSVEFVKAKVLRRKVGTKRVPSDWMTTLRASVAADLATKTDSYQDRPYYLACYCAPLHVGAAGEVTTLTGPFARFQHLLS